MHADLTFRAALLAATASWLLASGAALAQAQTDQGNIEEPDATMASDAGLSGGSVATQTAQISATLPTVSITATRSPMEAFEYPGMVSVVDREQMQLLQPSSPDDVLRFIPNVEFVGGPRRTGEVPTIRGFSGPDVVVLIDGTRQNFGSAHDGRLFVDPSLLTSAEVLRGPASALYGSGGTGGVIELRTLDAADLLKPGERLGATFGGGYQFVNNELMARTMIFGRPEDNLDILGSVVHRNSGSIDLGNGTSLENTSDDIISGLVKGSYSPAPFHRIEASFQRFTNDAREPNNGQDADASDIVDKEVLADTYRLAYGYNDPANRLLDLDLVVYRTEFQVDETRLDSNGGGPVGELLERDVDTTGVRLDNRSRFEFSDSIGVTFTYGGEAYTDEQNGAAGGGERDGVPDAEAEFYGAFAQAELSIAEPFGALPGEVLIIPGVRYDYFHTDSEVDAANSDDAVSPRIGVSYLPTDWLLFFANYAHAFRAPTFDELYLTGTHFFIPVGAGVTNSFVPNPDLKPQRTETLEFGAGVDFDDVLEKGDRFKVKGTYFNIWGEDFIDLKVEQPELFVDCNPFIPGACNGITFLDNVPRAKLWGSEVEASYENARVRLALGYSHINGENRDTGAYLGSLAPEQVAFDAGLKLPEFDSIVGWRVLAAAKFDKVDDESEKRDGYVTHDIYAAWQPSKGPLEGLRLDLGVDNVFDKSYSRVYTEAKEAGVNVKGQVSYTLTW